MDRPPSMVCGICCTAILGTVLTADAWSREVVLPIRPDTAFLNRMIEAQAFTDEDGTSKVWDDGSGCNFLILSDPIVTTSEGRVLLESTGDARVGKPVGANCITVSEWSGTLRTFNEVSVDPEGKSVRFRVIDSEIVDNTESRGIPLDFLWKLIKDHAHPRLDSVHLNLEPALNELKGVLSLMLSGQAGATEPPIQDIELQSVAVASNGLEVGLALEVPIAGEPGELPPERPLTEEELALFESAWQGWDGFVTYIIKHFALRTTSAALRHEFLSVLIDARYDLVDILRTPPTSHSADPVRVLFVKTWLRLSPLLRRLSPEIPGQQGLNLMSFVTASDALLTLDALGPQVNIDISVDGLRRMARMIAPDPDQDPTEFKDEVDPELRELFDFGPPLKIRPTPPPSSGSLWNTLFPRAYAQAAVSEDLVDRLNSWVPNLEEIDIYLGLVHRLLSATGDAVIAQRALEPVYQSVFTIALMATAWQESCWRQFVLKDQIVVPVRSPGGAVGMMQIVPRVWRGFYQKQGLAEDIAYNAAAGAEILMHYMTKYAIAKEEHKQAGGIDNIAWASYAAYNGGPGHLKRYRNPETSEGLKRVDQSFQEKYRQLAGGDQLAVRTCFVE